MPIAIRYELPLFLLSRPPAEGNRGPGCRLCAFPYI